MRRCMFTIPVCKPCMYIIEDLSPKGVRHALFGDISYQVVISDRVFLSYICRVGAAYKSLQVIKQCDICLREGKP